MEQEEYEQEQQEEEEIKEDDETIARRKIWTIIEFCEKTKQEKQVPQDVDFHWGDDDFPPNDSSLYWDPLNPPEYAQ